MDFSPLTLEPIDEMTPLQMERVPVVINNIDNITGVFPSGTLEVAENGTYDVTTYKDVEVETPTVDSYFKFTIDDDSVAQYFFRRYFLKTIPTEEFEVGENVHNLNYAFYQVYTPFDLVLTGGSTSLTDMDRFMDGAVGITSVDLSELTTATTLSLSLAFRGCTSLEKVVARMPNVYDLAQCFSGCTALKVIDFRETGKSTAQTYNNFFRNCSALEEVMLGGSTVWKLDAAEFTGSAIAAGTCLIYVPDDLVDDYKTDTVWGTYADQIKPISELPEDE